MPKIVVIGSTNVDMIIKGDRIPKPGETVIGGKFHKAAGGKGANQAVAAARAGGDVTFISCIGDDVFGQESLAGFKKEGIDVDKIKTDTDNSTGIAFILVDENGENSISVASGANNHLKESDIDSIKEIIQRSDLILLQLEIPISVVQTAIRIAYESNVKVILNPAPAQTLTDKLLSMVSVLTPNETETEILTGIKVENEQSAKNAAKILSDKGVGTVIITIGDKGVYVTSKEDFLTMPGYSVTPVDTTAAGDTFNGAFAVYMAEGKGLKESIRFANAAGAISVTRLGAQPSIPMREEIEELINLGGE